MKNKIPWLNIGVIDFLQKIITKDFRVLELGSGDSTAWFAERAKYVLSYEHNKRWFGYVSKELKELELKNCKLILDSAYPKSGVQKLHGMFDLIFIDGRGRVKNTELTMKHVTPGGYLMLDDSQRRRYNAVRTLLNGWEVIEFIEPGVLRTTTAWKKGGNKL